MAIGNDLSFIVSSIQVYNMPIWP